MMKAPEPLYPCKFCSDDYSWPASDLAWSERYQDWVCGECWCDNCHDDDYEPDEKGERLSTFLLVKEAIDLATLRAKAEAWDKGVECFGVFDASSQLATISAHPQDNLTNGYTCRKVRVCQSAAAGEKPALANKY